MNITNKNEKTTKSILVAITALVMISGSGTNVDETDNPAAKIKEFSVSGRALQISKPEKLKTFLEKWLIMSKSIKSKETGILNVQSVSFDNNKNVAYSKIKSNFIDFKNKKPISKIDYENENIISKKEIKTDNKNVLIKKTKSKTKNA
jgi:hypothetical protein